VTNRSCTIAIASLLLSFAAPALGQTSPDPGAAANVRQSGQYERALQGNSSFRAKRIKQECGPINDPQLHQQCVDSFGSEGASSSTKHRQQ
jgi:hypothetical protein